jgi:porin
MKFRVRAMLASIFGTVRHLDWPMLIDLQRTGGFPAMLPLLAGFMLLIATDLAQAQPVDIPPTWGGDIWSRPRLTGDWDGARDDLGKDGIVFDVDLTSIPQDVASGGPNTGTDVWNNADYTINVDTGKMGLWPGGFFNVSADSGFGNAVNANAGTIVPVNTGILVPGINVRTTALMNATFMQFLSTKFGLFAGKIDTLALGTTEFYGDYHTQFINTGLAFPLTALQVPISAFGGGIIALPTEDIILSAIALDPDGTPTNNDLGSAFSDGVTVLGSGQLTVKPFGLVGHQSLGIVWSDKNRLSLSQDPDNIARLLLFDQFPRLADPGPVLEAILRRFFPGLLVPTEPLNHESSSWSMSYGFDQYFWQPDGNPKHGIGLFFLFGASDGNPTPVQYSFIAGIGGKGVVPGRADDSFGIGVARTQFSGAFVPFLRQTLNLGLEHEDAFEAYYNAAITPWINATADIQVVDQGIDKTLTSSRPFLRNVDDAVILGARFRVRF